MRFWTVENKRLSGESGGRQGFLGLVATHLIGKTPHAWPAERRVGRSVAAEVLRMSWLGMSQGAITSLNTGEGSPLLTPCLSIFTRVFQRSIAETAGMPIYPSANFRPFLLFATPPCPLNEVSGVTACCSALLDWLPRSPGTEAVSCRSSHSHVPATALSMSCKRFCIGERPAI